MKTLKDIKARERKLIKKLKPFQHGWIPLTEIQRGEWKFLRTELMDLIGLRQSGKFVR